MITHEVRFPNESDEYRAARDELLQEELEMRARVKELAARRRALPDGGALKEDYEFDELDADGKKRDVRLSQLFPRGRDSLIVYSYMFSADMDAPCPMCTSLIDGFEGNAQHVTQRAGLVVVAKSPIERLHEVARAREWRHVRLLSSSGNTYNADYHGETGTWSQVPMMNVFHRTAGGIRHFWASELTLLHGQIEGDPCHVDAMWPLWNFLDVTREGRGEDWYPRLAYGE